MKTILVIISILSSQFLSAKSQGQLNYYKEKVIQVEKYLETKENLIYKFFNNSSDIKFSDIVNYDSEDSVKYIGKCYADSRLAINKPSLSAFALRYNAPTNFLGVRKNVEKQPTLKERDVTGYSRTEEKLREAYSKGFMNKFDNSREVQINFGEVGTLSYNYIQDISKYELRALNGDTSTLIKLITPEPSNSDLFVCLYKKY